ncbi:MAG: hypothetical protein ACRER1_00245 [Gammaproteobacteria bacterium]
MPNEAHDAISTTELVRNFSTVIDQVRIQRRPLAITKGNRIVAELAPPPKPGYPIAQLARLLAAAPKLKQDAAAMAGDLALIRRHAVSPGSSWGS